MEKILNFNTFLAESESSEGPIMVTDDVVENLISRSPILNALNSSDSMVRISCLDTFYDNSKWSKVKHEDRINGLIVSLRGKEFADFIKNLDKDGIIVSPDWFQGNQPIHIVFAQSDKIEENKYSVDTWYATSKDHFLNIEEIKSVKSREFVVEYNASSRDQLLKIVDDSITEVSGIIEKVRVMITAQDKWPNGINQDLKKYVKECYQKSVSEFFLEGKKDLIKKYTIENILIYLFKDTPGSIEFFIELPDVLRDKIIDSSYLETIPDTDTIKSLKAQNKVRKLMKYI
jgi:hypothetical protein